MTENHTIAELLYENGKLSADRAYVFEINEDYTTTNTYEWCKEGVTPQIDNLKGIPFESMPNWIHLFLQGGKIS